MSSQLNLEKVRREPGGHEPSSDQKIMPVTGTKVASVWIRRGLTRSGYAVPLIRKYLFVMSQWAHITRDWECPQAAPAWPVAMAAKPINGRS
jgi:hypothetical protein